MARYSSNFGKKLQMMVGVGKECGLKLNFDMFDTQIGVTAPNSEQPIRLPNSLLYPKIEVEQRTHSGDEIAQDSSYPKNQVTLPPPRAMDQS